MFCYDAEMRDLVILFVHVIATPARFSGPGGMGSVVAESVLVNQQVLILNRSRQRSPNLRTSDRLVAGLCALLIRPARLIRSAIVLKPSTLLSLYQALRNRKYRLLFSSNRRRKPGPKGPNKELIEAVVQMKQRNPAWFGVHAGTVDGVALCRMFNRAIRWQRWMPKYLSSDHDPLYRFGQWQANLRILDVTEIKPSPMFHCPIPLWNG